MISKDRETVPFKTLFEMKGAVEIWLNELVKFMQITLKVGECYFFIPFVISSLIKFDF